MFGILFFAFLLMMGLLAFTAFLYFILSGYLSEETKQKSKEEQLSIYRNPISFIWRPFLPFLYKDLFDD